MGLHPDSLFEGAYNRDCKIMSFVSEMLSKVENFQNDNCKEDKEFSLLRVVPDFLSRANAPREISGLLSSTYNFLIVNSLLFIFKVFMVSVQLLLCKWLN